MTGYLLELLDSGGYLGIFLLMMAENVFPPIPSEVIMGGAGLLVAKGRMTFGLVWLVATFGTLAGNLFWFWVGKVWSEAQLKRVIDRWGRWLTFDWQAFTRARGVFRRHGEWIIFVMRFSPVLRTMVSLPAGLAHMRLWRFCLFTFLGSGVWNAILIFGGRAAVPLVARFEALAGWSVIAMLAASLVFYLYRVATWKPAGAGGKAD